jgi:hypothetical protein
MERPMPASDKPAAPRIVRRLRSAGGGFSWSMLNPAALWSAIRPHLGLGRGATREPITTPEALGHFLDSRASFVAQTSLYGYLRTRAGMRYPELFADDVFIASINIAKWHLWLDCLADVAVHAGGRLARHAPRQRPDIAALMVALVSDVLARTGIPPDAGPEFGLHAERVRERLRRTDWLAVGPDEAAFTASPAGLVRWAPVMDELKKLDEEIVRNSVRFRWQEVRRDLARLLDADALVNASADRPTDP